MIVQPTEPRALNGGLAERLMSAFRSVGVHVVAQVHARLELLQIDLAREKHRLQRYALLCASALLLGFLGVLLLIMLVVAATWDTEWRIPAIAIMAAAALGTAAWSAMHVMRTGKALAQPFTGTLEELRKDKAALEEVSL